MPLDPFLQAFVRSSRRGHLLVPHRGEAGLEENTSRTISKNARSAGDFHRFSCHDICVMTSKGSPHRKSASVPLFSSAPTATLGKTETPMPAATHCLTASML